MPRAELISFPSCPNVAEARTRLLKAFVAAKLTPSWTEHLTDDPDLPAHARGFGSPTILIDGRDVAGAEPSGSAACRLYLDAEGRRDGTPSLQNIVTALTAFGANTSAERAAAPRWRLSLATFPGLAFAFLPKLACPACWPAYAGLLGSLGLGFLIETRWLLPLTTAFLATATGALAYRAKERHGLAPFGLGILAAGLILFGKFRLESATVMYAGVSILIAASIWNTWPKRESRTASCTACSPARTEADFSTDELKENLK